MQIEPEIVQEFHNKKWSRDIEINQYNIDRLKADYFYWMRLGLIIVYGEKYIYRKKPNADRT